VIVAEDSGSITTLLSEESLALYIALPIVLVLGTLLIVVVVIVIIVLLRKRYNSE